ncbi:MAG: class II aldolase/adducin family protein [Candidatus Omnitrophota bacterium]|nr:class II aldolase/adducin family protein [Candidatus Omnitrophota bacterium]
MKYFLEQKEEIIFWAKELHNRSFINGPCGNISLRIDKDKFLVTAHNAYLGYLEKDEIIPVDKNGVPLEETTHKPTSEIAMHLGAYKNEQVGAVIHAHPNFTTAFYAKFNTLDIFSYEARLYLSNIPVIEQDGPVVTNVLPVLEALSLSNIVVLKKHGIISVGSNFKEAFSWAEALEEACKVNIALMASTVNSTAGQPDSRLTERCSGALNPAGVDIGEKYDLFSQEHIKKIVSLVNEDKEVKEKGEALNLTTKLAIKVDEENRIYNFHFNKGKIDTVTNDEDAEFVISGPAAVWRMVFDRRLDPFAAATQRKLKLKGDMAKLSRWYAPFNRIFDLWKLAPVK